MSDVKATTVALPPAPIQGTSNHIYFYSDVNEESCLNLARQLRETDAMLRTEQVTRGLPADFPIPPIWLHIQSGGGWLFSSFALADQIAAMPTPVYSVVEGFAASGATLIAMACDQRYITPNSFFMVHQLSGFAWGTHEEFKDELNLQKMAMQRLVDFYAERTGQKKKTIREMLKRNTWMNSTQAIERGFADALAS